MEYECKPCSYTTCIKGNYVRHIATPRHISKINNKPSVYECKPCFYYTSFKSCYDVHNKSIKHKCKVGDITTAYVYLYTIEIDGTLENYVGGCYDIVKRQNDHTSSPYNTHAPNYECDFYQFMRNNYLTIDDFNIQIVYHWVIDCKNRTEQSVYSEIRKKEQEFLDYFKPSLNTYYADGRNLTKRQQRLHQYYLDNKTVILQKSLQHYNTHKDTILQNKLQKINCNICNKQVSKGSLNNHQKNKKCVPTTIDTIKKPKTIVIKPKQDLVKYQKTIVLLYLLRALCLKKKNQ
jgi:hypothetical protein